MEHQICQIGTSILYKNRVIYQSFYREEKRTMRKDWIKMPMWIFTETNLSPTEACILALLIDRAKLRNWATQISLKEIAEQLNISTHTAQRAIGNLEGCKLISVKRTGKKSIYQIAEQARIEQQRKETDEYKNRIKLLQREEEKRQSNLRVRECEPSFTADDLIPLQIGEK